VPRVRGMHGQRLDNAVERAEGVVARVLRGIARTIASLVGGSPSTAALSTDDLQPIRREWEKAVGDDILPVLVEAYAESARTIAAEFADAGRPVEPVSLEAPETADFLDAATNRLVGVSDTLWEIARKELGDGIRAGEGVEELAARLQEAGGFGIARARMIARTEVVAASNAASLAQALRLGDASMTKTWADADDDRVRPAHVLADGQTVPVGEPFEVDGESLMYPGQPIGSAGNVINERCTLVYDVAGTEPLAAAAEVHTGAMVALRPSLEDAKRLAVDGGEPADQLHATLAYVGAAADIPDAAQARIIEAIWQVAEGLPPLTVEGFAVSAFNPGDSNDRDPCIVLGLSGDGLDDFHGQVGEALSNLQSEPAGFTLPEQHAPWQPHITLIYTDDVSMVEQLADRVGPVTFDAIRVAFAGEVFDIPLGQSDPESDGDSDEGGDFDWSSYFEAAIQAQFQSRMPPQLQAHWIRRLRLGTKGSFERCVRELREYFPEDTEGLCANLYKTATGRWPSQKKDNAADPDEVAFADAVVEVDRGGALDAAALAAQPGEHFHTWATEGVSTGLRLFAPGAITWRDPPFAYHDQVKSSAHGGVPETIQTGLVTRVQRIGDVVHFWGRLDLRHPIALDYARRLAEGWARWSSVGADESVKEANIDVEYVLSDGELPAGEEPEVDLMTFRDYRVAEVTAVSVPALADALVEPTPELIATLTDMGVIDPTPQAGTEPPEETPEDTMGDAPAVHDAPAVVVAAGHTITLPEAPPAAWFDEPADDELPPYGSVRVDAQGRLIGLLAPAEVNHRSFPGKRVKVPMGNVDYSGWQNKPREVAEGHTINVGVITMDCGHASTSPGDWSYSNRRLHYDNTCSIAAHARAYEKPGIGVALAGAIVPWLDAEGFGKLLSSDLSGDWPPHPDKPGWRDFIAALAVPVGGFANRARLRVAEGALVAAAVPVQFDDMEFPMEMTEEAPPLAEGTQVRVLDPLDPEVSEGEIAVVHTGPAYALLVPGRDEPARWYVAEELEVAETAPDEPVVEPVEVEEMVASGGPDLRPVMEVMARSVGRDAASRMAALRNRVHRTD
jgi:2'-5' RNA ligase